VALHRGAVQFVNIAVFAVRTKDLSVDQIQQNQQELRQVEPQPGLVDGRALSPHACMRFKQGT
jgi:hypothetical protein